MLVSIIIPCFNEKEYIEEIIKRTLGQNTINKEKEIQVEWNVLFFFSFSCHVCMPYFQDRRKKA